MDNLVDSEYEKIGKEVYSQLTVYESYGHIGMSAALFLMVACGALLINIMKNELRYCNNSV